MKTFAVILGLLLIIFVVDSCRPSSVSPSSSSSDEPITPWDGPTLYDIAICAASKAYLPIPHTMFGCSLYRAQLYAESRLDPEAVSPAGAAGIAQFMPATWSEVLRQLGEAPAERTNADIAIRAGAFYMAQLRSKWKSDREEADRMRWSQGSYNAGFGGILNAQSRCGGALEWESVKACVPTETRIYVDRIWRYWRAWTTQPTNEAA